METKSMAVKIVPSNNDYYKSIALTMKKQLIHGGYVKVLSWGAHNWSWGVTEDNEEPTLTFEVNGNHFKGEVRIIYDPMDYYRVEFVEKESGEVKDLLGEVYFDELTTLIDEKVEKVDAYVF